MPAQSNGPAWQWRWQCREQLSSRTGLSPWPTRGLLHYSKTVWLWVTEPFSSGFGVASEKGEALGSIQGLNQKLEKENAELRNRLSALERLVNSLAQKQVQDAK
jgi:hypothetical protein